MLLAGLLGAFGDVGGTDRAEQLAFAARLRRQRQLEAFELAGARLRGIELLARGLLDFGATRFELRDVVRGGQRRLALRQQEVAAVAGLHLDAIADVAEVRDLLQQNDFHRTPVKTVQRVH